MTGALAMVVGFGSRTLSVTCSPPSVSGSYGGATAIPQNIATSNTLAIPSGGREPYTYAWTQSGASAYTWTISNPTAANTFFTATAVGSGAKAEAAFVCTVTDASGLSVAGPSVRTTSTNISTA